MNENEDRTVRGLPPDGLCRAIHEVTCLLYSWQRVIPFKKEIRFALGIAIHREASELDLVNLDVVPMKSLVFALTVPLGVSGPVSGCSLGHF